MEQLILDTAYQWFTTQGVQSFTMDDIASRLGMSKKTLYRYFVSRQELVEKVANRLATDYEAAMVLVDEKPVDSLRKLLGYIGTVLNFCKKINPVFFSDLRRHYPVQYIELNKSMESTIGSRIIRTLEAGIQEGLFRGNLHPQLVIAIWQQHMATDFEFASQLTNDYSKDEVFRQALYLFLYGVATPAAIPLLEEELHSFSHNNHEQTVIAHH
ncbi:MAG: TetR/AcrR family transcriptional regulator [Chitinophagaceae bacterium]|nr:TetR/AcrR family transcriptional regulator [Chitinophagaceae bacterium]